MTIEWKNVGRWMMAGGGGRIEIATAPWVILTYYDFVKSLSENGGPVQWSEPGISGGFHFAMQQTRYDLLGTSRRPFNAIT